MLSVLKKKKQVIYYRVVVGENWLADERAKASIREWESGKFSHDADDMRLLCFQAKMSKYTDGIIERRILFYSAYFAPPWDLKRNQKQAFIPCCVHTRLWCAAEPCVRQEVSLVRPCALSKKGQLDSARGSAHCHDAFSTSNRRESAGWQHDDG